MTNAIEALVADLQNTEEVWEARDAFMADPTGTTWRHVLEAIASRALAALSAPALSGLTEEERADQALFIDLLKTLDVTDEYYRADFVAMNLPQIIEIMQRYAYAESLSPAPGIDWKRVEEARKRHEYAAQKGGDLYAPEYCEWTFSQTHADRAFLLSLLPDALKGEVKP